MKRDNINRVMVLETTKTHDNVYEFPYHWKQQLAINGSTRYLIYSFNDSAQDSRRTRDDQYEDIVNKGPTHIGIMGYAWKHG